MKIFANIPTFFKAYGNLPQLTQFKKEIEKAKVAGDLEREKEYILKATSTWGKSLSKSIGMDLELLGCENLPKNGPVVYMSNHQSFADIVALCAVLDTIQFGFIAKDKLDRVPLYGSWINRIRSVMINRDNAREGLKAISKGISFINDGFSLLIFPEGKRSQCPDMGEFKAGAMKIATKPGVPIIPISLDGTWRIFEEKGRLQKGLVKIKIHPPIETENLSREEEKHLSKKIYDIIHSGVLELQRHSEN